LDLLIVANLKLFKNNTCGVIPSQKRLLGLDTQTSYIKKLNKMLSDPAKNVCWV